MKIDISYSRLFTFNIVINANYYIFHILATSSHLSGRGNSLTSQKTVSSLVSVNISRIHPLMFIHQRMIFTISVFTDYLLSRQLQSSKYSEQTASHIVRTFRKLALDVRRNQMSSDNNISLVTCFHLYFLVTFHFIMSSKLSFPAIPTCNMFCAGAINSLNSEFYLPLPKPSSSKRESVDVEYLLLSFLGLVLASPS